MVLEDAKHLDLVDRLLKPTTVANSVREHVEKSQTSQKQYYNSKKTINLTHLRENSRVYVQIKQQSIWTSGIVIAKLPIRVYKVKLVMAQ